MQEPELTNIEVVALIAPSQEEFVEGAAARRAWLSVLAKAPAAAVEAQFSALPPLERTVLRPPETGMVMVRGRTGGSGDAFNLGEMTVTRCAIRLASGETGIGYVAGRDRRHAEIAATLDAMMQSPALRSVAEPVIEALAAQGEARKAEAARKAAATKVEFFTMVTGRTRS
jgi:alpha-D-ribose 1-methylphosphonate 5-triphosphate synthase subunit PhnG